MTSAQHQQGYEGTDAAGRICYQLGYYFSPENLCRPDTFLLSRLNYEPHRVSIPLSNISGFKKLREITTDAAVLEEAIRGSSDFSLEGTGDSATIIPHSVKPIVALNLMGVSQEASEQMVKGWFSPSPFANRYPLEPLGLRQFGEGEWRDWHVAFKHQDIMRAQQLAEGNGLVSQIMPRGVSFEKKPGSFQMLTKCEFTFFLPRSMRPLLIGRGGNTIKQFTSQFHSLEVDTNFDEFNIKFHADDDDTLHAAADMLLQFFYDNFQPQDDFQITDYEQFQIEHERQAQQNYLLMNGQVNDEPPPPPPPPGQQSQQWPPGAVPVAQQINVVRRGPVTLVQPAQPQSPVKQTWGQTVVAISPAASPIHSQATTTTTTTPISASPNQSLTHSPQQPQPQGQQQFPQQPPQHVRQLNLQLQQPIQTTGGQQQGQQQRTIQIVQLNSQRMSPSAQLRIVQAAPLATALPTALPTAQVLQPQQFASRIDPSQSKLTAQAPSFVPGGLQNQATLLTVSETNGRPTEGPSAPAENTQEQTNLSPPLPPISPSSGEGDGGGGSPPPPELVEEDL